ncbi:hypothetical protein V8C34DRAFT_241173 [Trichoderma compactum]
MGGSDRPHLLPMKRDDGAPCGFLTVSCRCMYEDSVSSLVILPLARGLSKRANGYPRVVPIRENVGAAESSPRPRSTSGKGAIRAWMPLQLAFAMPCRVVLFLCLCQAPAERRTRKPYAHPRVGSGDRLNVIVSFSCPIHDEPLAREECVVQRVSKTLSLRQGPLILPPE